MQMYDTEKSYVEALKNLVTVKSDHSFSIWFFSSSNRNIIYQWKIKLLFRTILSMIFSIKSLKFTSIIRYFSRCIRTCLPFAIWFLFQAFLISLSQKLSQWDNKQTVGDLLLQMVNSVIRTISTNPHERELFFFFFSFSLLEHR